MACLSHQLSPGLWFFAALYKTRVLWAGQSGGGGIVVRWEHTSVFLPGLGSPIDREAWRAAVHGGHKESDMIQQLNNKNKWSGN